MEQLKKLGILFFLIEKSAVRILEKYVKLYLTKEIVGNTYTFKTKKTSLILKIPEKEEFME